MDSKENTEYWNDRAIHAMDAELATHRDRFQRRLELRQVMLHWPPYSPRVLDIGCGAGWTAKAIAPRSLEVVAIDRSSEMILSAKERFGNLSNVRFEIGDALALPEHWNGTFDLALSQRCLINLSGWEEQKAALDGIARVLKPGGILILQEGTAQGRESLNRLREQVGLKRMPAVPYNRDFDEELLWPYLRLRFRLVFDYRFEVYDLLSRVVHPLVVAPNEPEYHGLINEVALRLAEANLSISALPSVSREFSAVLERGS